MYLHIGVEANMAFGYLLGLIGDIKPKDYIF